MSYFVFRDSLHQWRWRLRAANGRIIADSGEAYYNKQDCEAAIRLVKASTAAPVIEQ